MNRLLAVGLLWFVLISCQRSIEKKDIEIDLPFFNDTDLTPVWIDSSDSLYNQIHTISAFEFINQNGDTITNDELDGKVYVANFFFTICPSVCPKMTNNLHKVQQKYGGHQSVKILSHTVMPWADSVARLAEYARMNNIKKNHWHLLTGEKSALYGIARQSYFADEGFGKNVTDINDFLHTEKIDFSRSKKKNSWSLQRDAIS